MKRLNKYMMLFVASLALVSCVDDVVETPSAESKAGEDVQFGLTLPSTRTVYGNEDNDAFPVYWDQGDKVQIYSPECAAGRNDATYTVTPKSGQSYAEALSRTNDYGVQWGDNTTANFYSVYPSLNAEFSGSGDAVTAKLNISSTQKANLSGGAVAADMNNVIMYAQTNDVVAGDKVNLKYTPYSTVLEFILTLGESNNGWGKVRVSSFTLTAPEGTNIAGDFNLTFNGSNAPTIKAAGNNSNQITVTFETAPILNESNQTAKINVALIPLSGVANLDGWTASVEFYDGNDTKTTTKTKTLNGASTLAPGKIHKIWLPEIVPAVAWSYTLDKWISTLYDYKNIYLTELSLPGAWYAGAPTKDGYQATDNITTLWNAGIRAFAVECKTSSNWRDNPEAVVISGTGDNGAAGTGLGEHYRNGDKIRDVIKEIANSVAASLTTDSNNIQNGEFAVLVLSYADGGTHGLRNEDFSYFINGIKTEITNSRVSNVYSDEITANTTVGDVLGKLIIKINVDDNLTKSSYAGDMNALISYNPFMKQLSSDKYSTPLFSKLYWKEWEDTYKTTTTTTTDFLWCFSSANRTKVNTGTDTTIPSYEQRQTGLRTMITHSREISEGGSHNVWFYFNAGGTQTTSQSDKNTSATDFASTMNPWLLEVINLKSNGGKDTNGYYTGTAGTIVESDPSPLGIVMFNQCTAANNAYKGDDIIKAIVDMNDKFKLQRKAAKARSDYDGTLSTGGNAY